MKRFLGLLACLVCITAWGAPPPVLRQTLTTNAIGVGSAGEFLTSGGGVGGPTWSAAPGGGDAFRGLANIFTASNQFTTNVQMNARLNFISTVGTNDYAALDTELAVDGTFPNLANWTIGGTGTGWASVSGAQHTPGNVDPLSQTIALVGTVEADGNYPQYFVMVGAHLRTNGTLTMTCGALEGSYAILNTGTPMGSNNLNYYSFRPTANGNYALTFTPSATYDGTITNVSVKRIIGTTKETITAYDANGLQQLSIKSVGAAPGVVQFDNPTIKGMQNIAYGLSSMMKSVAGHQNLAIGPEALHENTTGFYNTALGGACLYYNSTGHRNTAIGNSTLQSNTTGHENSAVGYYSLYSNTTGNYNNALGRSSLFANVDGGNNNAFGNWALNSNVSGWDSSAFGHMALYYSLGSDNTALGYLAGTTVTTANAVTTGSFSTYVGSLSGPASPTQHSYLTVVGAGAVGDSDNTVVLGRTNDNVCVGTTNSTFKFNVGGTIWSTKALAPATADQNIVACADAKFLCYSNAADNWAGIGVNAGGNLWLRTGTGGASQQVLMFADGRVNIGDIAAASGYLGINCNPAVLAFAVNTNQFVVTNGMTGSGIATPTSKFHVAGPIATAITTGGSTTLDATHSTYLINVNANTITLPTPVGCQGRIYTIKAIHPCASATITNVAGMVLDGATSYTITATNQVVVVQSDNAKWWIINKP